MATSNMQMQTFVAAGFDGYNGDLTGDVSSTLGTNCGMSTGRNGVIAFAANQRDEVRDLHDVAGALGAQPGMKQQTFIAAGFCPEAEDKNPIALCLMDQGGERMDCLEDKTGTLRAQMRGHQPLIFENHTLDSRCTGPHPVAPTMSARYGTGGNNVPLVAEETVYCITGNAIDRQPQNGGNGMGYQEDIAYTLTTVDRHAVFDRKYKDATDLGCQPTYQETVGVLTSSDRKGPNSQYVGQDKLIVDGPKLIRRLTPLECELLQGFPPGWTDIPGVSDSARYKALGNSIAIPCVEYLLRGVAYFLENKKSER